MRLFGTLYEGNLFSAQGKVYLVRRGKVYLVRRGWVYGWLILFFAQGFLKEVGLNLVCWVNEKIEDIFTHGFHVFVGKKVKISENEQKVRVFCLFFRTYTHEPFI